MALSQQEITDTTAKLAAIATLKTQWEVVLAKIELLPETPPASVAVIDEATNAKLVQFKDAAQITLGLASITASLNVDLEDIYDSLQAAYASY